MSCKLNSKNSENQFNGTRNGQALMNISGQHTTVKSKVDFIYGAVPSRSKNDILLVLQSCDDNVEAAISIFSQGRAEDVLSQWSHKGKKSKDGNKKKRHKKKQSSMNVQDIEANKDDTKNNEEKLTVDSAEASVVQNPQVPELQVTIPSDLPVKLTTNDEVTTPETNVNSISTTSSDSSMISDPATPIEETAPLLSKQRDHSNPSHHKNNKHHGHHPKVEKVGPTTGADALKKTTKDLSRSSFSLARYQLVLEEECEQSFKRMKKAFDNIRNCVSEREAALNKALKEFKEHADNLLQQRLEDAAALKLKTERVPSMSDEQVALLRADIKNFVAERKIDEELAQTKRFVCDEDNILQGIKTFGEILPIKNTYTPVKLNHPTPSLPTQKPAPAKNHPSLVSEHPTSNQPSVNQPTAAAKNPELPVDTKNPEPTPSVVKHSDTSLTGRPPKIEALISSAMAKSSKASESLHDAAEVHLRLKESLKQQGVFSQNEGKKGSEHHHHDNKQQYTRPNTAPHQPARQQYRRTQEQRQQRPQSNRQHSGNRSHQRQNKDEQISDTLNETSQTDETRRKTNQRGPYGQTEKGKQGNEDSSKSPQVRHSNPRQEREGKRPQRRRRKGGKDPIAEANEEEQAGDSGNKTVQDKPTNAVVASTEKDPLLDVKEGERKTEDVVVEDKSSKEEREKERHTETNNQKTVENADSMDSALPQREPRNQNRRRFRGPERETEYRSEDTETTQVNGSNNHATNDGKEKAVPDKEDKIHAKLAPVVAQAIINGHSEAHKSTENTTPENDKTDNLEINGFVTTNGNGEDCLVER